MTNAHWYIEVGNIYPLGSSFDGEGVNFALYSAHAEKVELCLFTADGSTEVQRLTLPDCTSHVWNGYVRGLRPGAVYGYRVHGPYQPELGHRFNPHKLLLDPYARQLAGEFTWCNLHFAYQMDSPEEDLSFDARDNAAFLPKCVVVEQHALDAPRRNRINKGATVVYEAHVKGMTMQHPAVPAALRGTFAGLGSAAVIAHLRDLGITSLELLPIQGFLDEQFLIEKGLRNYWGYNTLTFFAPHRAYFSAPDLNEFRALVAALHEAGIEVILDVVYNHTAEGAHLGPTFSFRGIDNASYYKLQAENPRYYVNDTGCGNTLDFTKPVVIKLVLDSLRYWVTEFGVDGFRFDLATVLGRESHGFERGSGFFDALHQDPVLAAVKFIAEPWDIGPGGYQLGNFPTGWSEWNDRFRDTVRRFWRGDAGMLPEIARRLHGSSDIFEHNGRRPSSCINFITCHDGFTLKDVVCYRHKHNDANQEDNRDGHSENYSDNYGVEGPVDDPLILAIRNRQQRNLLMTLVLAQGTPMLCAGDELGHSMNGNNNAYCQDSPLTWLGWENLDSPLLAFTRHLLQLKRSHPLLWNNSYLHESTDVHEPVIRWIGSDGEEMQSRQWAQHHVHHLGYLISPLGTGGSLHYLVLLNADARPVEFVLPLRDEVAGWRVLLDASLADGKPMNDRRCSDSVSLQDRCTVLLVSA